MVVEEAGLTIATNHSLSSFSQHLHLDGLYTLTFTVLVVTTDAHFEAMGDVGSARYEQALLPPCPTIRVLSYSN